MVIAENKDFRIIGGQMGTNKQQKLCLSADYDKRFVLSDKIHTEPIEFHR